MVVVPIARESLEEHEWAPGTVAQLILGEIARNRIDPGRELLRRVEAVQVPRHPDERFLHQVLRAIAIPGLPGDEVDEPVPIPIV